MKPAKRIRSKHRARKAEDTREDSDSGEGQAFVATMGLKAQSQDWIIDSGASRHMTFRKEVLYDYKEFEVPEHVGLGDGRTVKALGTGRVKFITQLRHRRRTGWMMDVLYVPKLTSNLFSVHATALKKKVVLFGKRYCWIRDQNRRLVGIGSSVGKLYKLDCAVENPSMERATVAGELQGSSKVDLWHRRLAHVNINQLCQLMGNAKGVDIPLRNTQSFCEACVQGKMHRSPHKSLIKIKSKKIKSKKKLQLVHTDVCGPMQNHSFGGSRYFITFIDDYSRCCKVYFLKRKSEALEKFKEFKVAVENESGMKIRSMRADRGGEYLSGEFKHYLKKCGIRSEFTAAYSPQQNGVAERMNRTLMEAARSMMSHASLSKEYWAEAVATAAYLRNRMVTTSLKPRLTPYQQWYGEQPNLENIRVFGCVVYAHIPGGERKKEKRKCYIRHDVIFNKYDFGRLKLKTTIEAEQELQVDKTEEPTGGVQSELDGQLLLEERENESEEAPGSQAPPRRSQRVKKAPIRYGLDEYADTAQHVAYQATGIEEPANIKEALSSNRSREWKVAADCEYKSLIENKTWELVKPSEGRKAIGCKWVFRVKYDGNGRLERFKGRLVAQGFSQKYGIDYDETFSPVARFSSIRTLLAFSVERGMLVHQMDVVTAFLNGDLKEEIYMQQPPGYVQLGKEDLVCKLKKSLYGLKQSPRCWNEKLCKHMKLLGYRESGADPCVFIRLDTEKRLQIIAVYVDDLILIAETVEEMQQIKRCLSDHFKMKDMGKLHYCLGVNIDLNVNSQRLLLSQKQYLSKLLEKYGLTEANPVSTPIDPSVKLMKDDGYSKRADPIRYQSMVGSLLHAARATRPDIALAVGIVSKFNANPTEAHLTAVKRIFRYLKGTANLVLQYKATGSELIGYADADWANRIRRCRLG